MTAPRAPRPRRARLDDRGDDLYETPVEATEALLLVEPLPRGIWEPAQVRRVMERLK